MPTLRDIQHRFRASMLGIGSGAVEPFIVADGMAAADRVAIYRNTYVAVLTRALRLSYPAVGHLVGDAFFDQAARAFIAEQPARSAWLDEYGEGFAEFLADFRSADAVPYLAEVAALEWAVACALHAEDRRPLDLSRLAALSSDEQPRAMFAAHPAASLLRTLFPVDAIWRAVLARDEAAMAAVDLAAGPRCLLVRPSLRGVDVDSLSEPDWQFTRELFAGRSLQEALDAAPDVDASVLLGRHFTDGLFTEFRLAGGEVEPSITETSA